MSEIVNTIYGLYANSGNDYTTVHSISLSEEKLKEIIDTEIPNEIKEIVKFEIKPIKVYLLTKLIEKKNEKIKFSDFDPSKNLILTLVNSIKINNFKNKIFAFNKITTENCIQCLVAIAHDFDASSYEYQEHLKFVKRQKLFDNNISFSPIKFDIYYDEGILNV